MKKIFHIIAWVALLIGGLSLVGCKDDFSISGVEEGIPTTIDIAYSVPQMEELTTRAEISESAENRVNSLILFIVNKTTGQVEVSQEYASLTAPEGRSTATPDATAFDNESGSITGLEITSGVKLFYLLANVANDGDGRNFALEGVNNLSDIRTVAQLDAIVAKLKEDDILRPGGGLFMSCVKEETVSSAPAGGTRPAVKLPLERMDTKVTFKIETADGIEFRGESIQFLNVARKAHAFSSNATPFTAEADFFSSSEHGFDPTSSDNIEHSFTAYLPENIQVAKKNIENGDANLRDKQLKSDDPSDNSKLVNGAYEYAPDYATRVKVKGSLLFKNPTPQNPNDSIGRYADVEYNVALGKIDGINDYSLKRNTHYTYTLTIKGVDNIVLEAKSDKANEVEAQPAAEGLVVEADTRFVLDSYYEQVNWILEYSKISHLYGDDGKLNDDAKIVIQVRTPFTGVDRTELLTYTKDDLEAIVANTDPRYHHKKGKDINWVTAFIHSDFATFNTPLTKLYTHTSASSNGGDDMLFSIEKALATLLVEANKDINGNYLSRQQIQEGTSSKYFRAYNSTRRAKLTFYINDYFYRHDPAIENPDETKPDNNLWRKFANAPDRRLEFVFKPGQNYFISPDSKSEYAKPDVSIRQLSIKTFFTDDLISDYNMGGGIKNTVWGVNNFDAGESTSALTWKYNPWGDVVTYQLANGSSTDGWRNTYRYLTWYRTSKYESNGENDPIKNKFYKWPDEVDPTWTDLHDENIKTGHLQPVKNLAYRDYLPLLVNRDNNRDNKIDAREISWYTPSIAQLVALTIFQKSIPPVARLTNSGFVGYASSSMFPSVGNYTYQSNPLVLGTGKAKGETVTLLEFMEERENTSTDRSALLKSRVVRDLGFNEPFDPASQTQYRSVRLLSDVVPQDDRNKEAILMNVIARFDPNSYTVVPSMIDSKALRKIPFIKQETPVHSFDQDANMLYVDGFRVAKKLIRNEEETGKPLLRSSFEEARDFIRVGKSVCATYYEDVALQRDKGYWRLPTASEMAVMMYAVNDWDSEDKDKGIDLAQGAALYMPYLTATSINSTPMIGDGKGDRVRDYYTNNNLVKRYGQGYQFRYYTTSRFRVLGITGYTAWTDFDNGAEGKGAYRCVRDNIKLPYEQ